MTGLAKGDTFTLQWRDARGTFDARDAAVVEVMKTSVQTIDSGQVWVPLARLREHDRPPRRGDVRRPGAGRRRSPPPAPAGGWIFRDPGRLPGRPPGHGRIQDRRAARSSTPSSWPWPCWPSSTPRSCRSSTGAARWARSWPWASPGTKVIGLFTLEGMLNGVLAALVAAAYGIPLLSWMARTGWALPGDTDSYGFAIGERLFPSYSLGPRRRDDAPRPADDDRRLVPADAQDRQAQADRRAAGAADMIRFLLKGLLRDRSRSLLPVRSRSSWGRC